MNQPIGDQLLVPFIVRFFFVFGLIGLLVGVGLILDRARMHRFLGFMNTWVSVRRSTKWLAVPRDISPTVQRFRHLIGATFILFGAFSTVVLMMRFDVNQVVATFAVDAPHLFVAWIVDGVRWFLIAGGMLAITIGIMLIVFPSALRSVEDGANRWVSFRTYSQRGDAVHRGLDIWVESYPRATGWVIAVVGLSVVVVYGLQLFVRH
jgi:hypothetical protein